MSETNSRSQLFAKLQQHTERVKDVERYCDDEAKTETYLVEPFLEVLGYGSRDPRDVVKRYTADVPGRKGEKVDYALMRDEDPVVLVEAKGKDNRLGRSEIEQLQRYFPHTPARLAVLTDGILWHWYKGRSDPDQTHQMESSPFLTYDAREPSETAAEWLTQVTKNRFNPDELLRIARRDEFATRISDWISRTLINPSDTAAVELSNVVGLDASSQETQLVVDAIRSAWDQVLVGHQGDICEPVQHSTVTHAPGPIPEPRAPTTRLPSSRLIFDAETHTDDSLDIGNGQVLNAKKFKRAWRSGGGKWKTAPSATALTTALLELLLKHDARRDDESILAELHELIVYSDSKPRGWVQRLSGFKNLYYHKGIPNNAKIDLLKTVAGRIHFDPPEDSPLGSNPTLEVWLVNVPK